MKERENRELRSVEKKMSSDLEMYLLLNEIASQGVNEKYKKRLYDARSLDRSQLIRINASMYLLLAKKETR